MKQEIPFKTYHPSRLHTFFALISRLPGPSWLYYLGLIVSIGLLNLIAAWIKQILPWGEINWYFASTAFFLGYYLFVLDIHFRVAKESVTEYLPKLNKSTEEVSRILYEFTHLPARESTIVFIFGFIFGVVLSLIQLPDAKELNPAFPGLEVMIFSLSISMAFLADYAVIRASKMIMKIFGYMETVDIYDLTSIYSITKYSALVIALTIPPTYLVFILAPTFVEITSYFFISSLVIYWAVVLLIFWLPLRYVNRKLVLEKKRLLIEINVRIKKSFELIHKKTDFQEYEEISKLRGVIDSLKIEKEFIESISTWPWKPTTITGLLSAIIFPLIIAILSDLISKLF